MLNFYSQEVIHYMNFNIFSSINYKAVTSLRYNGLYTMFHYTSMSPMNSMIVVQVLIIHTQQVTSNKSALSHQISSPRSRPMFNVIFTWPGINLIALSEQTWWLKVLYWSGPHHKNTSDPRVTFIFISLKSEKGDICN